ncbi:hypothetical protein T01_15766 [Trichinella spiralis]|uniref:Uncharacterized protein n=1 Tax=Trichinella spiralis TaxID=6334 RepID=A0A0V1BPG2_TRISP|nr:hypothetical protein T01_15766 [Trichinella spiralis]
MWRVVWASADKAPVCHRGLEMCGGFSVLPKISGLLWRPSHPRGLTATDNQCIHVVVHVVAEGFHIPFSYGRSDEVQQQSSRRNDWPIESLLESSNVSSICGKGWASLTVTSLRRRKSTHNIREPSFLRTMTISADQGLFAGSMMFRLNISVTIRCTSWRWGGGSRRDGTFTGAAFRVSMRWEASSVWPRSSSDVAIQRRYFQRTDRSAFRLCASNSSTDGSISSIMRRDKLLNRSSRIRVTAAPVSSRSWESVLATLACSKIDDGLVKATTCTASCWERPVGGVGSCIDGGPLGRRSCSKVIRVAGQQQVDGNFSARSGRKASIAVISPVDGFFPKAVRHRRCRFISSTIACMLSLESLHGLAFQIAFTCSRTMKSVRPKRTCNNSMACYLTLKTDPISIVFTDSPSQYLSLRLIVLARAVTVCVNLTAAHFL